MIYLYWYLGTGAVILFFIAAAANRPSTQGEGNDSLAAILADLQPVPRKLWVRLLEDVIGPVLIGLLVLPFWPIIIFFKIKNRIFPPMPALASFEETEFTVTQKDLLSRIDVSEIETREMITDPMDAVPNLPFGHLNDAWHRFLERVRPADAIWSFSATWTHWGHAELRQGYVVVREDGMGPYFLTTLKYVEENTEPTTEPEKKRFDWPRFFRKKAE